jgi:hypothetical protein
MVSLQIELGSTKMTDQPSISAFCTTQETVEALRSKKKLFNQFDKTYLDEVLIEPRYSRQENKENGWCSKIRALIGDLPPPGWSKHWPIPSNFP